MARRDLPAHHGHVGRATEMICRDFGSAGIIPGAETCAARHRAAGPCLHDLRRERCGAPGTARAPSLSGAQCGDRATATESAVLEQPPQSGPFEARRTAGIAHPPLTPNWPVPPNDQHDRTHPHRPCLSVRRPARCHRRDVGLAENSEDVIDWLLVHQTGSYSAKDAPGRRPARLRARRHWMLRRARPPTRWSTLRGPPRLR